LQNTPPYKFKLKKITATNIRQLFNDSEIPNQIDQGLLKPEYLRNKHLKNPHQRNEPYCTHAQFIFVL